MKTAFVGYRGGWPCGVFYSLQEAAAAMGISYRMARYYAKDEYRKTHDHAYIVRISLEDND